VLRKEPLKEILASTRAIWDGSDTRPAAILVVPHTFGRHLNFNPHIRVLVSVGGLRVIDGSGPRDCGLIKGFNEAMALRAYHLP
jgi:hypothetical protein